MTIEKLFPVPEAVYLRTGRRPALSTIQRWVTRGVNGIRMESKKIGGRRMTTLSNVDRFIDLSSNASGKSDAPIHA